MEAGLVIILGILAYICWNILAIKDGIEHTNARLNNINIELLEHRKMIDDLKPKGPIELPTRLDEDVLKKMIPELKIDEFNENKFTKTFLENQNKWEEIK